jgi:UDP-hydrolysing UDP-N-acetyl-D-glucosamine 2-epimerase
MVCVLSITTSRADIGILSPVWRALAAYAGIELQVLLTGMHMLDSGAGARQMLPDGVEARLGGADLGGEAGNAARAMSEIAKFAGEAYGALCPDVVLVAGDRLDMIPAATATLPFNLPIAHLHGGEITQGAVDDRIRHALSKLAHWHCVSCTSARERLLAMGEPAARITVTGAPGLDTLLATPEMPMADLTLRVGLPADMDFRLVTVHPETNAPNTKAPLTAVLEALSARPGPTLFTAPNSDPGSTVVQAELDTFVAAHDWAVLVETLGPELYPNALRHAAIMLGNSSSGIIEAGLFGLPVINVGDRQRGRERGQNVIDVANSGGAVIAALDKLGPAPTRFAPGTPYGTGGSGRKVAEVLLNLPDRAVLLAKPGSSMAAAHD